MINMVAAQKPVARGAKNQARTIGITPLYGGIEFGSSVIHRTPCSPSKASEKPMIPAIMECVADTLSPFVDAHPCQAPPTSSVHIIPYEYAKG